MAAPDVLSAAARRVRPTWFWGAAAAVLALDQASKWAVAHFMTLYQSLPVLGSFLRLTYVRNPGAAFSFLAQPEAAAWRLYLLCGVAIVTFVALAVWVYREPQPTRLLFLALGLVGGGALGNLTDRLAHGEVVDFIEVSVRSFHWPVFNLADSAVDVGAVWLLIQTWRRPAAGGVPHAASGGEAGHAS